MSHKVILKKELTDIFEYAQIYCTASCCEESAFEVNQKLLLRKKIDMGTEGIQLLNEAWKQLQDLIYLNNNHKIKTNDEMVPIWYEHDNSELPQYHLNQDKFSNFLNQWDIEFQKTMNLKAPYDYNEKGNVYIPKLPSST